MLDAETKRRIDTARDILVGKIPDPKSQVEQITIALIYKFMYDMDEESVEMGGKETFFSGEYKKYAWNKIVDISISGPEMVNLYRESIQNMNQNPNIPKLFRDIFKNAYLPYRDPETLKMFLKVINEFHYDHSEKLGDAFEYLLSVLGSQGEAGQFRTPRHIIDFMVEITAPKKDETILDPACGTAGFLISAYKHILKHNSTNFDPTQDKKTFELQEVDLAEVTINSTKYSGDNLTSDDRARLVENIYGYDISPDMVRLSLVNMYLHQLNKPKIYEYDTLSSEDRWEERADVIMANPPFMSPKGGIKPHKRFSIQSKRSEVLFVDYIAEHLTPQGRATVIVPEGIIFQSQTSHKKLRKMLIENDFLVGVISLPAGVFNPYSGVKTSILWMDKQLAKKTDKILFIKIENDGFNLGAQRRPIKDNDLPNTYNAIQAYKNSVETGTPFNIDNWKNLLLVEKTKIAESGDSNLTGTRYKITEPRINQKWPLVELGEICKILKGSSITKKNIKPGQIPVIAGGQKPAYYHNQANREGEIITISASGAYAGFINFFSKPIFASDSITIQSTDNSSTSTKFIYYLLKSRQKDMYSLQLGMGQPHVYQKDIAKIKIPLPPLSVQQEIVDEIEGYQKIIDSARQIICSWKPCIDIDPAWPMVQLGEVCELVRGVTYSKNDEVDVEGHKILRANNISLAGELILDEIKLISKQIKLKDIQKFKKNDIFICLASGSKEHIGKVAYIKDNINFYFGGFMGVVRILDENVLSQYVFYLLKNKTFNSYLNETISGVNINNLSAKILLSFKIPLPPIETQKAIVEKIEQEQKLINANKKLVEIYEEKIKARISKVWGD